MAREGAGGCRATIDVTKKKDDRYIGKCECGGAVRGARDFNRLWTWCEKCSPVQTIELSSYQPFATLAIKARTRALEAAITRFYECGVTLDRMHIVDVKNSHPMKTILFVDGIERFTWSVKYDL